MIVFNDKSVISRWFRFKAAGMQRQLVSLAQHSLQTSKVEKKKINNNNYNYNNKPPSPPKHGFLSVGISPSA